MTKQIGLFVGPMLFFSTQLLPFELFNTPAHNTIAIGAWMIAWWVTEAVSLPVTALLPLALFPMLDIMDIKTVSANYGNPIVFLFFGGFIMALALEKVNLHQRIALNIIKATGTKPNQVILGFMLATAALSMWISNTATTVIMLPIALSVVKLLIDDEKANTPAGKKFSLSLMLGIAYAANLGGIATIIGTPPNIVMVGFLAQQHQIEISFLQWLLFGVPFSLLMIAITYFVIVKLIYPNRLDQISSINHILKQQLEDLGKFTSAEKRVLTVFAVTMLLWITRSYINEYSKLKVTDTEISLLAALALLAIPYRNHKNSRAFILVWKDTTKLPWGILILFGGGLALAGALSSTGVVDLVGNAVSQADIHNYVIVGSILVVIALFMTELMSNVALVAVFAPVVSGIALGIHQEILLFLIPVTIASSCAFMLPMSTPPNAIVFAGGHIKVHEMIKAGTLLNLIAILILIAFMTFVFPLIL